MAKVANPFGMSCVLSAMGLVAIIANICIVVRYGRRRVLLMSGLTLCGILQLAVALTYQTHPGTASTGTAIAVLSGLYMMSYNVSAPTEQRRQRPAESRTDHSGHRE